jgi:hypothetical protein
VLCTDPAAAIGVARARPPARPSPRLPPSSARETRVQVDQDRPRALIECRVRGGVRPPACVARVYYIKIAHVHDAAGALEKSKNEEWPLAGVSGSADVRHMVCDKKFAYFIYYII